MPVRVLTDCASYVDDYDFTTDVNTCVLGMEAEAKEKTTFGSGGWKEFIAGLRSVTMDHTGYWQSATTQAPDPEAFVDFAAGTKDLVHTFAPFEETPADPMPFTDQQASFFFRGTKFSYEPQGTVGEITKFNLSSQNSSTSGVVKGSLIVPKRTVGATGKVGVTWDTIFGGPGAGLSLYVAFHVFVAATTITVQVQSDDNTGFSSPTTQATIGPLTTAGGVWLTPIAGPITDRYWRLNVSAITGTFTVAASIGVR